MKSNITFFIRNFESDKSFNIGNFELKKETDYDEKIKQLKNEQEIVTYNAFANIEGKNIDDVKENIKNKEKEINRKIMKIFYKRITETTLKKLLNIYSH
jgi:Xaa-Pro aminopeptidase